MPANTPLPVFVLSLLDCPVKPGNDNVAFVSLSRLIRNNCKMSIGYFL
jgi:hypothetical protein